jgi:RNase adaptor protein for sRNA GlmZ degradation
MIYVIKKSITITVQQINGIKRLSNYDKPKNMSFDAQILNSYFAPDVSTKKSTGLNKEIQDGVFVSDQFKNFLTNIINSIEDNNLSSISIYCTFGRHRSVSTAEIIKKYLYPNSSIEHLTINK